MVSYLIFYQLEILLVLKIGVVANSGQKELWFLENIILLLQLLLLRILAKLKLRFSLSTVVPSTSTICIKIKTALNYSFSSHIYFLLFQIFPFLSYKLNLFQIAFWLWNNIFFFSLVNLSWTIFYSNIFQ